MKYLQKCSVLLNLIIKGKVFNQLPKSICNFTVNNEDENKNKAKNLSRNLILCSALGAFCVYRLYDFRKQIVYLQENRKHENIGQAKSNLPFYTMQEVSEHATKENRVWVTYKEGVYDITDFIIEHPGGEQILLAAGSSVEPFWMLYAVHNNPEVLQMLENLRIGNISSEESQNLTADMSDPYSIDPRRHIILKPASVKPFNAEPPLQLLVENFLTPNELFYVRNHLPVPQIDSDSYELEVEVEGTLKKLTLKLDELKAMPKVTITATIMCAGNRRSEMVKVKPVKGLNWGAAAVGNATWTGVRVRDVLTPIGITEDDDEWQHVQFEGIDFDPTGKNYGASIPFWKAMSKNGDVILAYEMNGVPIPRDHGFPIRVIVPGVVGARNVKWLGKIIVSKNESDSHWQQNDYKGFSPSTDWDTVNFSKAQAIQELPVISAICKPSDGEYVSSQDGYIIVKGYAWSGGGQKIIRVDITADRGNTWYVADLMESDIAEPPRHWSWTLWTAKIPVAELSGKVELWSKAVDSSYNTQPEAFKNIWNLRGVLSNAYHRITIELN